MVENLLLSDLLEFLPDNLRLAALAVEALRHAIVFRWTTAGLRTTGSPLVLGGFPAVLSDERDIA
jgi:hypothetical protein